MHKVIIFLIGVALLVSGFVSLWPAAVYNLQQFNTNMFVAFVGGVLVVLPLGMKTNGS